MHLEYSQQHSITQHVLYCLVSNIFTSMYDEAHVGDYRHGLRTYGGLDWAHHVIRRDTYLQTSIAGIVLVQLSRWMDTD